MNKVVAVLSKSMFLLVILLGFSKVMMAYQQDSFLVHAYESSAVNLALGGNPSGVANIWHYSPAMAHVNPALPALNPGLSFSRSSYKVFPGTGLDMQFTSGMASVCYEGIGLLIPAPNHNSGRWGHYLDWGIMPALSPNYEPVYVRPYDSYNEWGASVDLTELLMNNRHGAPTAMNDFDLGIGINYLYTYSKMGLHFSDDNSVQRRYAKEGSWDMGLIAAWHHDFNAFGVDVGLGYSQANIFDQQAEYIPEQVEHTIYRQKSLGCALGAHLKAEPLIQGLIDPPYRWFDDLVCVRILSGTQDEIRDKDITGKGMEIGFLDTFFFRNGRYEDELGKINGSTSGFGIDLHYHDLVSLDFNQAKFPGGGLMEGRKREVKDVTLNVNLIKL